ncbi:MAG: AbfB domain-containing protein [Planctomycetaceae bacterium]|nr:AbfB domain-containing protein [Planctomycetaceae bacterium]
MLTSVYVCAAVVFLASPLTCADEVHDKLTVAIEKHQERRDAAAAALVAVYQERITELTSKGDTTLASEYLNDMEEFKSRRALLGRPDLAIHFKTYGKAVKEAGDELNEAYSEAMQARLKAGMSDEFSILQQELADARLPGPLTSFSLPGTRASLAHGSFVLHAMEARVTATQLNATYEKVNGLAGANWTSFRSVNFPDFYLGHGGFRMRLLEFKTNGEINQNATFAVRVGLAGKSKGYSYESYNYPGRFIRVRDNGEVWLDQLENNPKFAAQATFRERPPLFRLW